MDRVLVEIMIVAALFGLAAITTSAFAAQYEIMAQSIKEFALNRAVYSAASTMTGAAAESALSGTQISVIITFPYPLTLRASAGSLMISTTEMSRTIPLTVDACGDGTGRIFNVTAFANRTVFFAVVG
jgi:hypothetical protein